MSSDPVSVPFFCPIFIRGLANPLTDVYRQVPISRMANKKKLKAMDIQYADRIFRTAIAFEYAAKLINKEWNAVFGKHGEYAGEVGDNVATWLTFPKEVTISFAVELQLKCLCVLTKKQFPASHNLLDIFDFLPALYQQKITGHYHDDLRAMGMPTGVHVIGGSSIRADAYDLRAALKLQSLTFEQMRYWFERDQGTHESFGLATITGAIARTIFEMNPNWTVFIKEPTRHSQL